MLSQASDQFIVGHATDLSLRYQPLVRTARRILFDRWSKLRLRHAFRLDTLGQSNQHLAGDLGYLRIDHVLKQLSDLLLLLLTRLAAKTLRARRDGGVQTETGDGCGHLAIALPNTLVQVRWGGCRMLDRILRRQIHRLIASVM